MKIAMIASEANPLAKSGGLADVVSALSEEYKKQGHEAIIVIPYYKSIDNKRPAGVEIKWLGRYGVDLGWRHLEAEIYHTEINGVPYYLIGNYYYFGRPNLYGYGDDGERFAFFALASIRLLPFLEFAPDIIHVHDWQSAIIPTLLKERFHAESVYAHTHTVLTIHNPAFKGYLDPYFLNDFFGLSDDLFHSGRVRFEGQVSTLKAGIVDAEKITTVSPTHREELLSESLSQGLCGILRLRENDFCGIVNGVDELEFDPKKDTRIALNFDAKNLVKGKEACRKDLLSAAEMEDNGGPIFGLVSRLTYQKGIDLILKAAHYTLDRGGNIIVLGSGEEGLENGLRYLQQFYPKQVHAHIGYSDDFAHKVYAGSDFFLMPSLFEPCGIGQLIAEKYGTLPVGRQTGGIADTVISYNGNNEDKANGFLFRDYDEGGLSYAMFEAEKVYKNKTLFHKLQRNALNTDNSWGSSAKLYLGIYEELNNRK